VLLCDDDSDKELDRALIMATRSFFSNELPNPEGVMVGGVTTTTADSAGGGVLDRDASVSMTGGATRTWNLGALQNGQQLVLDLVVL
jgi:hypothetical protein